MNRFNTSLFLMALWIAPSNQAQADPVGKLDLALTSTKTLVSCVAHLGYIPLIGASTISELLPVVNIADKVIWAALPSGTDGQVHINDRMNFLMSIPLGGSVPIAFTVADNIRSPKLGPAIHPDAGIMDSLPLTSTLANRAISEQSFCRSYFSQLQNEYQQYNARVSTASTKGSSSTRVGEQRLSYVGYSAEFRQ